MTECDVVLSPRLAAIVGYKREMVRLFDRAETPAALALPRYIESMITTFENMTDEEFDREYGEDV